METTKSPLSEADPRSLDDLYSDDPLNLTEPDLDSMVDNLRAKNVLWAKEEAESKSQGRKAKKVYEPVPEGGLKLTDLVVKPKIGGE